MTKRVALLVEGQTEEAFVARVLQPYIGFETATLTPIVVHTSRTANGTTFRGGGYWKHYDKQLRMLLSQPHWDRVTTLIDFYGYPADAPPCSCPAAHNQPSCVASREANIAASLPYDSRFLPFVALHEFETLVIAAGATMSDVLGDVDAPSRFAALLDEHDGDAEQINNGPQTAPSKRVLEVLPDYRKVRDGVSVLEGRLPRALPSASRFAAWIAALSI
ncbi:DUF4276 family protein [Microbacterium sp. NPDC059771]|uniref:DUF4276 family protein n=1 Tax=Microbacterium sp. NPDC059771 TaxID=3346941 RepID=UPI00365E9B28